MSTKSKIIWWSVMAVGVFLIFASLIRQKRPASPAADFALPSISPSVSPSVSVKPSQAPQNNQGTPKQSAQPGKNKNTGSSIFSENPNLGKLAPATCQLSGKLVFTKLNTFINDNGKISYQNIDSDARHINWTITPSIKVSVGPNLFAGLNVPNGEKNIILSFNKKPTFKKYTLSAKVTYGKFINGALKIFESQCSGKTDVIVNF